MVKTSRRNDRVFRPLDRTTGLCQSLAGGWWS